MRLISSAPCVGCLATLLRAVRLLRAHRAGSGPPPCSLPVHLNREATMRFPLTQEEYLRQLAAARRQIAWFKWLLVVTVMLLAIDGIGWLYGRAIGMTP